MPPPAARALHESSLLALTQIPPPTGREHRVLDWITRCTPERPALALPPDPAGNPHIAFRAPPPLLPPRGAPEPPIYFTAHLDHPAFVVERIISPTVLQLQF